MGEGDTPEFPFTIREVEHLIYSSAIWVISRTKHDIHGSCLVTSEPWNVNSPPLPPCRPMLSLSCPFWQPHPVRAQQTVGRAQHLLPFLEQGDFLFDLMVFFCYLAVLFVDLHGFQGVMTRRQRLHKQEEEVSPFSCIGINKLPTGGVNVALLNFFRDFFAREWHCQSTSDRIELILLD